MADVETEIAEASWAYALRLYQRPSASAICLKLQSEAGVDVMLLLVAIFAVARLGLPLAPLDIEQMSAISAAWRAEVVQPLRRVRTILKAGFPLAAASGIEQLRAQIKASELAAERLENDLLARWLSAKQRAAQAATLDDIRSVIFDVVSAAQRQLGEAGSNLASEIEELAALAYQATVSDDG